MTIEEIIDTIQVLCKMETDTYMEYKYMILADSRQLPNVNNFMRELFRLADQSRPLLICMGAEP